LIGVPGYYSVLVDRSGQHVTVYVDGELDACSSPELITTVLREVDRPATVVWLDLSAVTFCDLSALAAMNDLHQQVTSRGGRLGLHLPSRPVLRMIELTGIGSTIPVQGTPATTVALRL